MEIPNIDLTGDTELFDRSTNFVSDSNAIVLLKIIQKYKHIIRNIKNTSEIRKQREVAWRRIQSEFHLQSNLDLSVMQIRKKFNNLMNKVKDKARANSIDLAKGKQQIIYNLVLDILGKNKNTLLRSRRNTLVDRIRLNCIKRESFGPAYESNNDESMPTMQNSYSIMFPQTTSGFQVVDQMVQPPYPELFDEPTEFIPQDNQPDLYGSKVIMVDNETMTDSTATESEEDIRLDILRLQREKLQLEIQEIRDRINSGTNSFKFEVE